MVCAVDDHLGSGAGGVAVCVCADAAGETSMTVAAATAPVRAKSLTRQFDAGLRPVMRDCQRIRPGPGLSAAEAPAWHASTDAALAVRIEALVRVTNYPSRAAAHRSPPTGPPKGVFMVSAAGLVETKKKASTPVPFDQRRGIPPIGTATSSTTRVAGRVRHVEPRFARFPPIRAW